MRVAVSELSQVLIKFTKSEKVLLVPDFGGYPVYRALTTFMPKLPRAFDVEPHKSARCGRTTNCLAQKDNATVVAKSGRAARC